MENNGSQKSLGPPKSPHTIILTTSAILRNPKCNRKILDVVTKRNGNLHENVEQELEEAHEAILSRDSMIIMLKEHIRKLEEMYKKIVAQSQENRFKYCSTAQDLRNVRQLCQQMEKCCVKCGFDFNTPKMQHSGLLNKLEIIQKTASEAQSCLKSGNRCCHEIYDDCKTEPKKNQYISTTNISRNIPKLEVVIEKLENEHLYSNTIKENSENLTDFAESLRYAIGTLVEQNAQLKDAIARLEAKTVVDLQISNTTKGTTEELNATETDTESTDNKFVEVKNSIIEILAKDVEALRKELEMYKRPSKSILHPWEREQYSSSIHSLDNLIHKNSNAAEDSRLTKDTPFRSRGVSFSTKLFNAASGYTHESEVDDADRQTSETKYITAPDANNEKKNELQRAAELLAEYKKQLDEVQDENMQLKKEKVAKSESKYITAELSEFVHSKAAELAALKAEMKTLMLAVQEGKSACACKRETLAKYEPLYAAPKPKQNYPSSSQGELEILLQHIGNLEQQNHLNEENVNELKTKLSDIDCEMKSLLKKPTEECRGTCKERLQGLLRETKALKQQLLKKNSKIKELKAVNRTLQQKLATLQGQLCHSQSNQPKPSEVSLSIQNDDSMHSFNLEQFAAALDDAWCKSTSTIQHSELPTRKSVKTEVSCCKREQCLLASNAALGRSKVTEMHSPNSCAERTLAIRDIGSSNFKSNQTKRTETPLNTVMQTEEFPPQYPVIWEEEKQSATTDCSTQYAEVNSSRNIGNQPVVATREHIIQAFDDAVCKATATVLHSSNTCPEQKCVTNNSCIQCPEAPTYKSIGNEPLLSTVEEIIQAFVDAMCRATTTILRPTTTCAERKSATNVSCTTCSEAPVSRSIAAAPVSCKRKQITVAGKECGGQCSKLPMCKSSGAEPILDNREQLIRAIDEAVERTAARPLLNMCQTCKQTSPSTQNLQKTCSKLCLNKSIQTDLTCNKHQTTQTMKSDASEANIVCGKVCELENAVVTKIGGSCDDRVPSIVPLYYNEAMDLMDTGLDEPEDAISDVVCEYVACKKSSADTDLCKCEAFSVKDLHVTYDVHNIDPSGLNPDPVAVQFQVTTTTVAAKCPCDDDQLPECSKSDRLVEESPAAKQIVSERQSLKESTFKKTKRRKNRGKQADAADDLSPKKMTSLG